MKTKRLLLGLLSVLILVAAVTAVYSDGRRRQADANMLSGIASQYFQQEYSRFVPSSPDLIIRFPSESLSDEFLQKTISSNFNHPIWMLNLSREHYLKLTQLHSEDTRGHVQSVPLVWSKRKNFGRTYYVYWGVDGAGAMSESEIGKVTEKMAEIKRGAKF